MSGIMDFFNHRYKIKWVSIVAGYHDDNGTYVPPDTSSTLIKGHISDVTLKEKQFLPEGAVEAGIRLFATSTPGLKDGDLLIITEDEAGTESVWYILKAANTTNVLKSLTGIIRYNFYISRQK